MGSGQGRAAQLLEVATSTFQAEMLAAHAAFVEGMWIMNLLKEMELIPESYSCPFFCDNQAVVSTSKKPPEDWTRNHLNTKYFQCSEHVQAGHFLPAHIPGKDNPADIFTKGLDVASFCKHRDTLMKTGLDSLSLFQLFQTDHLIWKEQYADYHFFNCALIAAIQSSQLETYH